jgi:ABC-2 type transport system permease protein
MLKQIWAITRKDIKLFVQQPGQWAVIFLTPFLFIAIMGQIFGESGTPTVAIYAVNEDSGKSGQQVIERLEDSANLEVKVLDSRDEADQRVGKGQRMAAVVVPDDFTAAMTTPEGARVEMIVDPARQESANIVIGLVNAALGSLRMEAEVTRGVSGGVDSAIEDLEQDSDVDPAVLKKFITAAIEGVISSQVQEAVDDPLVAVQLQDVSLSSGDVSRPPALMESLAPGYTLMFAFFLISTMATTVLEERNVGTFRRLLSTPISRPAILLGKIMPYLFIAIVQLLVLMGVSSLVFGISLGESLPALLLVTVAIAASVVGMGIMVASLAKTGGQAGGLASLLATAMAAVSGGLFPSIRVPFVEYITPHFWAIQGFQDVISRGLGVSAVLLEAGILLGMAAIFFGVGVSRLRLD